MHPGHRLTCKNLQAEHIKYELQMKYGKYKNIQISNYIEILRSDHI